MAWHIWIGMRIKHAIQALISADSNIQMRYTIIKVSKW